MQTNDTPKSFSALIAADKPVLVDFFAEWCGPCKMMKPVLEQVKAKIGDKAVIIKIDIDKSPGMARKYNIQGVPTLMIFRNNQIKWRQSGVVLAGTLEQVLQQNV